MLVAEIMGRIDNKFGGQIYRDGLAQMLEAPEFAENANVRKIVSVLGTVARCLNRFWTNIPARDDVQVVIAGDGRFDELQDISLVISSYGVADHATGMLGVVGPLRMSYGRTISAVRFVAAVMSDMVSDMVGDRRYDRGCVIVDSTVQHRNDRSTDHCKRRCQIRFTHWSNSKRDTREHVRASCKA